MEKIEFSIRINRKQTVNGRFLAGMKLEEAQKHFKSSKVPFSEKDIEKAHAAAVAKAKELDSSKK
jgi:hypothetical protein